MGNARMNALEYAYNTLVNIKKKSKVVKVVKKKAEFHELKSMRKPQEKSRKERRTNL
jgi:hypothetical protein